MIVHVTGLDLNPVAVNLPEELKIEQELIKGAFFHFNCSMKRKVDRADEFKEAALFDWKRRHPTFAGLLTVADINIDDYFEISMFEFFWDRVWGKHRSGAAFYDQD